MLKRILLWPLLIVALVLSPFFNVMPEARSVGGDAVKDLVLVQNIPEVKIRDYDLKAVHVYKDGSFKKPVPGSLTWSSSNKSVAAVNGEGKVELKGKPGRTFISVTDGRRMDRIALHVKPVRGSKEPEGMLVKEKGTRYGIIDYAISKMSMQEKVGQMLMPDFRKWKGANVTEMQPDIERIVKQYHLGGVILFRENVVTTEQTARLVHDYQQASDKYGLIVSIDQEGGIVTRLQSGTDMPGNMALGAARSEETAYKVGRAIGEELAALGINMNFAPSLDVNNNPDNPVIGVRSFGEDPELAASLGVAYTKGLQSAEIAATAKHFPGHGDTATDSHLGLPEVPYDMDRLKKVELYPFQKAMDAGIDAVMTAHVTFPKIDPAQVVSKKDGTNINLPATLSRKVLTDLMREEMGFQGIITTDALNMQAIGDHFGPVEAVIRAVNAGTDIVLMPVGLESVANGLYEAIRSGEITEKRIEASVRRILALKLERGIMKEEAPRPLEEKTRNALAVVGSPEHKQIEKEAAEKSVTLVKNNQILPLKAEKSDLIAVIGDTYADELFQAISARHPNAVLIKSGQPLSESQLEEVKRAKAVIAGTVTANVAGRSPASGQMKLVNQLVKELDIPVIAIGIRNPYDIMAYPEVDAYLAQYSFRTASFHAASAIIFGKASPSGKLPVTIPSAGGGVLYPFGHGLTY